MTTLRKRRDETEWQFRSRLARVRQEARDRTEPIVPKEAERHGDYEKGFVMHVETATKAHTLRNRSVDAVERWKGSGRLQPTQVAAIDLCRRLWALAGISQRVTANYGERVVGIGSVERRAINEIEAREDLHRIRGYVPEPYWRVFENVVRHNEPTGTAGASVGFEGKAAQSRAYVIVCFVCDLIAMQERL